MTMDVNHILDLLDQMQINRRVLQKHDVARETFLLSTIVVRDFEEFKDILTGYVQHHYSTVGEGLLSNERAFGEGKRILLNSYSRDRHQDGYVAALQDAIDGSNGGMRSILNEVAEAVKRRALDEYVDHVYHQHIDPQSRGTRVVLSRAFYDRFGNILSRAGIEIDEHSFACDPRAALDYHRQVIEKILGIGKKMWGRP